MSTVEQTQPLISHLLELRNRLLKAIAAVLVVFVGLIYFPNHIYEFVSAPLVERLPEGATMIATDVASPFFTLNTSINLTPTFYWYCQTITVAANTFLAQ